MGKTAYGKKTLIRGPPKSGSVKSSSILNGKGKRK